VTSISLTVLMSRSANHRSVLSGLTTQSTPAKK